MLKRLHLRNFTVFADAEFEFGPGLNVLVGTNGTGKTHVLKAGYAMQYNLYKRIGATEGSLPIQDWKNSYEYSSPSHKLERVF